MLETVHRTASTGAMVVGTMVVAFTLLAGAAGGQTGQTADDPIIARVDGGVIHQSELLAALETLPEQYRQMPVPVLFPQLLDQLISRRLLANAARAENIHEDETLRRRLILYEERLLQEIYLTRRVEAELTEQRLRAHYAATIAATPGSAEVHARHILLKTEADAKAVIAEIAAGADFTEVAKAKSTGPSAAQGGDLGFFSREQMVPEFSAAAFALEKGATSSEPVQTSFGWHVILVVDRRESAPPSFADSVEQIRQELAQQLVAEYVDELRQAANVETFELDGSPKD